MPRVAMIQQVHFCPRLHYLERIARSDVFVVMDKTQLGKHCETKMPIKTKDGVFWLTVPVKRKYEQMIEYVEIDWSTDWVGKMLSTVEHAYKKAPYFDVYFERLSKWLGTGKWKLIDLDLLIIGDLLRELGITTRLRFQSEFGPLVERKGAMMLALTKATGCDVYHCGSEAPGKIVDPEKFKANGVELKIQNWETPVYRQLWGKFVPDLSVFDSLMNVGVEGVKEILGVR